jgi:predicted transposase YbfD/YdcC
VKEDHCSIVFFLARKKYEEAIKLAPADNAPLRNLSAALYELGDYEACTRTAAKAIALLGEETGEEVVANVQKLNQRVEKAKIHAYEAPEEERRQQRLKISRNLPRYRPSMFVTTEYFNVGHDVASTLFGDDGIFERFSAKSKKVSFFFGGVGDARNAFQTLSVIAELEKARKIPHRQYHITLNDIHKAALARDLVICLLLEDLSKVDENSDDGLMILNTIFFIFISTMMPAYAFDHLNQTIDRALGSLKAGRQPLKWLYLHKKDLPDYLAALGYWRDTAPKVLTNRRIMTKVAVAMMQKLPGHLSDPARKPFKNEEQLYREVAVLFPPLEILKRHDPEMLKLAEKVSSTTKGDSKAFEKHIEEHWHWNVTLMDKEWYGDMERLDQFDVGFDPFETINHFPYDEVSTKPKKPDRLYDYVAPFFIDAAKAIKHVGGRLQVEAMLGDYAEIAERLQFDLFKTEDGKKSRPEHFPTVYVER